MCGLNGLFAYNPSASPPERRELLATRDHMAARGPDEFGEWWSAEGRIGLGHRRLSILDLSDRARQPMASVDGRYQIVFNGEIYNFPELRQELEAEGQEFRTTSDTEALLCLFARHGENMVHRLRGMFAFAIWDNTTQRLFLARDPYGIKPLYTCNDGWTFRFASQVKALLAGGRVSREPEPAGVVGFHLWGSVPEPYTLYRDIRSLPAGHYQWVDEIGPREPRCFARIATTLAEGAQRPAPRSELCERVQAATAESVKAHLLADVEVGVFLSAGVDSGAILGLMRDAGQTKLRAITLAFEEFRGTEEDEAPLAASIAAKYGADHVVRRVTRGEFEGDLPRILDAMDQPSIDGVNTWLVSRAAREAGLKVALSGLGGDELLAGYPSFRQIPRWVGWLRLPGAVPGLGVGVRRLGEALRLARNTPKALGMVQYGGDYAGAYLLRRGLFLPFELKTQLDPDLLCAGLRRLRPLDRVRDEALKPNPRNPVSRVASLEASLYMRNQLLRDADWAGMAHSVEIRTPLVDYQLLKALAPVVPRLTLAAGKRALAAAPASPLPASITERRKTGFGVPTGHWIASDHASPSTKGSASRAWALRVLNHTEMRREAPTAPLVAAAE